MKINLEVTHFCTIKRKKPWPKLAWIGKEKQQLLLLDNQRLSIIDPKNGKTKRKISKISSYAKTLVSHNISDNGIYFVAILTSGDLIIWNKDKETIANISGLPEFALKLGLHCPSVFISDDSKKIILVTTRNKVFVWESEQTLHDNAALKQGNWTSIVASKEIKIVEDSKELTVHVRFNFNPMNNLSATCSFAFNYESKLYINILRIKWINRAEITSNTECRFETAWICHQPEFAEVKNDCKSAIEQYKPNKLTCLYTRGAYVLKLSHSTDLLAVACNQKYVDKSCLFFMSTSLGTIFPVNLRNFGLSEGARGRHYWIQELTWMFNDLYLAGITKHGAIFLVSRLGHPLLIHAFGKEIDMGPALYLVIHPLIVVRGKSSIMSHNVTNDEVSLTSTAENEDSLRQQYFLARHPTLPILACSDGYLLCIFRLQKAFSTQSRLIRELVHEAIGSLNEVAESIDVEDLKANKLINPFKELYQEKLANKRRSKIMHSEDENLPDWGIQTSAMGQDADGAYSGKSSDSGVSSNEDKNRKKGRADSLIDQKIAEGKIIFSFLPQVVPVSTETLKLGSVASKMENSFEYLQASWTLLISMQPLEISQNTYECDQTAKVIEQTFTRFSHIFLLLDSENLKQFQIYQKDFVPAFTVKLQPDQSNEIRKKLQLKHEEEFKVKVIIDLFLKMVKLLNFDTSSKYNPNKHMILYLPSFAENFLQMILKFENLFTNGSHYAVSRINIFGLTYTLLNVCENLMKSMYKLKQNNKFILNTDPIITQLNVEKNGNDSNKFNQTVVTLTTNKTKEEENNDEASQERSASDTNSGASKELLLLIRKDNTNSINFIDFLFEKCWLNLMHYANKYRNALQMMGSIREKQLNELNIFIILVQRRLEKFPKPITCVDDTVNTPISYHPIGEPNKLFQINPGDMIYLEYGNTNLAIDNWLHQLNNLFALINNNNDKRQREMIIGQSTKIAHKILYACLANYKLKKLVDIVDTFFLNELDDYYSPFNLSSSTFKYVQPPKPLQRTHLAIVSLIKSLARFIAFYITDKKPLFVYSINNPIVMPSIIEEFNYKKVTNDVRIELSKERITACLNSKEAKTSLCSIFCQDKVLELLMVTGLYDEAIYFLNLINDWKSAFMIGSILKESENYENNEMNQVAQLPNEIQVEHALSIKLCTLFGIDQKLSFDLSSKKFYLRFMEKGQLDSVTLILKELLLCSVVVKANVLETLLFNMLESLVFHVDKLTSYGAIVPEEFYLPAPPIYCSQMETGDENNDESDQPSPFNIESYLRIKICALCKCFIVVLSASNLHVALIKWYLDNLVEASSQMNRNYGIKNFFQLNLSLSNLLTSIRYQKLGYISENILHMFRDFCSILFFMDLRDKFSLTLRKYTRLQIQIQNHSANSFDRQSSPNNYVDDLMDISMQLIDLGNIMLSYRLFLKQSCLKIQDIILTIISKLTMASKNQAKRDLNLEEKLAECTEKKMIDTSNQSLQEATDAFDRKLFQILDLWYKLPSKMQIDYSSQDFLSMAEIYERNVQTLQQSSNPKLLAVFGLGEETLHRVYIKKLRRANPFQSGSYAFERSSFCADFLELFFKLSFDQTENWNNVIDQVNQTPLLPEFYDIIRNDHALSKSSIDKQYILKKENYKEDFAKRFKLTKDDKLKSNFLNHELNIDALDTNLNKRRGLLRTYKVKTDDTNEDKDELSKLRKSLSLSNLNQEDEDGEFCSMIEEKDDTKLNVSFVNQESNETSRNDQPFKLLDYGDKYVSTSNLAIWLMKWANQFQKILLENSKSGSLFWYSNIYDQNKRASITLKLNSLNANFLVGCVYFADGNNLEASARAKKPRLKRTNKYETDDDLTQISYSFNQVQTKIQLKNKLVNKLQNKLNNEENSSSSTLDISSLTESQVNKIFTQTEKQQALVSNVPGTAAKRPEISKLERQKNVEIMSPILPNRSLKSPIKQIKFDQSTLFNNKSKDDELVNKSMSSTVDISEFYNLANAKGLNQSQTTQLVVSHNESSLNIEEILNKSVDKPQGGVISETLGFITNLFGRDTRKSQSRSPNPRSPTKTPQNVSFTEPSQQLTQQQEVKKTKSPLESSTLMEPSSINKNFSSTSDVQELIRNELKRIVQMQHDTVMSFLNGGTTNSGSMNPMSTHLTQSLRQSPVKLNNLDQQLVSALRQQHIGPNGEPMEFIIETKIKKVDPISGQPNSVSSVYASNLNSHNKMTMQQNLDKSFDNASNNYFMKSFDNNFHKQHQSRVQEKKKSSFIKIPLLNSRAVIEEEASSHSYTEHNFNHLPYIDQYKSEKHKEASKSPNQKFKLVEFKSDNRSSHTDIRLKQMKSDQNDIEINKHIKNFSEMASKSSKKNYLDFPLLKLNFKEEPPQREKILPVEEEKPISIPPPIKQEETKIRKSPEVPQEAPILSEEPPKAPTKESKEVQIEKPLYDGYILAPEQFNDLLMKEKENDKIYADSALAHYKATEHLRNAEQNRLVNKNKKDIQTMTDNLSNAYPISPDILFKLGFKSNRKDQLQGDQPDSFESKDFVNVVDLDSNAVDDILKLISHEQSKRKGKFVSVKKTDEKLKTIPESKQESEKDKSIDLSKAEIEEEEMPKEKGDSLTEKILLGLSKTEDDYKEYDELMQRGIEEANKKASGNINKQRLLNEFKFIDEKIKLMTQMADEMSSDYAKCNNIVYKIQDLNRQRELIEKYQKQQDLEDEKLKLIEKNRLSKENVKFYEPKDSELLVNDLKSNLAKPKPKERNNTQEIPSKKAQQQHQQRMQQQEAKKLKEINLDDDDLSDLKENEEKQVKKLLYGESQNSLNLTLDSKLDTANSITNVLNDIFNDLDVENADDLNSDKLDQVLNRSSSSPLGIRKSKSPTKAGKTSPPIQTSTSPNRKSKKSLESQKPSTIKKITTPAPKLKPSTSPSTARRENINKFNKETTKELNRTFEKADQEPTTIKLEKKMTQEREIMSQYYSLKREQDAKLLIEEMIIDNNEMTSSLQRHVDEGASTFGKKRSSSKSRSPLAIRNQLSRQSPQPMLPVPPLNLDKPDLPTAEMNLKNKKPSLMAKTIMQLKQKEALKRRETEVLLRDLELKALQVANTKTKAQIKETQVETRLIKPFTEYVQLQQPSKLREHTDHKPLTYGQQLKLHQERTVEPQTTTNNPNQIFKLYGTRRVKGIYDSYVKSGPRKAKTYSEMLKELKPKESQALIRPTSNFSGKSSLSSAQTSNIAVNNTKINRRHNLQPKAKIDKDKLNSANKNRFKPYNKPYDQQLDVDEKIEDLSSWSLDENLKHIIYDDPAPQKHPSKAKPQKVYSKANANKKPMSYKDNDQDTLADMDDNYTLENLLEDEKENDKRFNNLIDHMSHLDDDDDDYINQVDLDDLKNMSINSNSPLSSFIDWDQIDNIIDNFN